jgi:hypothetical protein
MQAHVVGMRFLISGPVRDRLRVEDPQVGKIAFALEAATGRAKS